MRVKIFYSNNEADLEAMINEWLAENSPSITEILQSGTEGWTTISIFYLTV